MLCEWRWKSDDYRQKLFWNDAGIECGNGWRAEHATISCGGGEPFVCCDVNKNGGDSWRDDGS